MPDPVSPAAVALKCPECGAGPGIDCAPDCPSLVDVEAPTQPDWYERREADEFDRGIAELKEGRTNDDDEGES